MGFLLLLLDVLLPSQTHTQKTNTDQLTVSSFQIFHLQQRNTDQPTDLTFHTLQKKNTVQLTDSESQTTIHTLQRKSTDQLTDSESQTNTTKRDTQRVTTTHLDAFQ